MNMLAYFGFFLNMYKKCNDVLCTYFPVLTFKYNFLKHKNTLFKNTTYLNSTNMYFQNTTGQRENTLMLVMNPKK